MFATRTRYAPFEDTHNDPQWSDVAPLDGTLADPIPRVNVIARCFLIAIVLAAAGCLAAFIHSFFR